MKIHIAGFPVLVGPLGRQLCAWCGATLFDVDYEREMSPLNPDGSRPSGSQPWEAGALIAVDGEPSSPHGRLSYVVPHEDGKQLPVECCAGRRPKLTAVR